jgi:molecular chaperone GrpE (heat shock protein)
MTSQLWIKMANLVFELEKKLHQKEQGEGLLRTIERMKQVLEDSGLIVINPTGEKFSETRTDVEATLVGSATGSFAITEVLKPIVYVKQEGKMVLLQKGVVLAG